MPTPTEKPCTCRASELPVGAPDPAAMCDACREVSELRDAMAAAFNAPAKKTIEQRRIA